MVYQPENFPRFQKIAPGARGTASPSVHEKAFAEAKALALDARYEPRWIEAEGVEWRIVRVVTGQERRVAFDLEGLGFRGYAPLFRKIGQQARFGGKRGKRVVVGAVFPAYVFVGAASWNGVGKRLHPALADFVGCGVGPSRIAGLLAAINEREMQGEWDALARPSAKVERGVPARWRPKAEKAPFAIGEVVRISEGPFRGLSGPVLDAISGLRVKVGVGLLGREVEIAFEACQIEKT